MGESQLTKTNEKILGVRIDNIYREEIKDRISDFLEKPLKQKFIATLNPEILLKSRSDDKYRDILNSAALNLCDGFGIKLILRLKGKKIKARFTGVELTDILIRKAKKDGLKVLVVVSQNSLSSPEEIEEGIGRKCGHKIAAKYFSGDEFFGSDATKEADIIFVNFGSPEQEKFIFSNRDKFPHAKILAGVGGAFDFLTGKIRRAPKFLRSFGMEWLWRLFQEPKRIRRIINAVVIFPVLALIEKEDK